MQKNSARSNLSLVVLDYTLEVCLVFRLITFCALWQVSELAEILSAITVSLQDALGREVNFEWLGSAGNIELSVWYG